MRQMLHTGLERGFVPSFDEAMQYVLSWTYAQVKRVNIAARNAAIRMRHEAGETLSELARAYNLSSQRIHQIVHDTK